MKIMGAMEPVATMPTLSQRHPITVRDATVESQKYECT